MRRVIIQGHQGHSQGIQPNILGFPKASSQTLWVFPGLPARQSGFPQGFQPNLLGFLKVSPPIGATTFAGELGDRRTGQNPYKCPELGLELFDYFIHNVEVLCSRADSVLLMSKARSIREVMVRNGVPEGDVPKSWFRKREEGENLRKQKHAANEKRLAAEKTLELVSTRQMWQRREWIIS